MRFLIERKVLILMVFTAITLLGIVSYRMLKMELFPNAELPMLYVQVNSRADVTPDYLEREGILPVEGVVGSLEGVERIESNCDKRKGTVTVYLSQKTDIKLAYLKLEAKLNAIKENLPEGITTKVVKVDATQSSNVLMNLQVRGSGGVARVRDFTDQKILAELENIDGVAAVTVFGGKSMSVEIILDRKACDAYKLTPSRIKSMLSANMVEKAYGGVVKEVDKSFFVYVKSEFDDIKQLENLILNTQGILLKDVATIFYGQKEETTYSRVNGKEAVAITIINDAQANTIDLSHKVRELVKKQNLEFSPYDIELSVEFDQAEVMEKNINSILDLALTGGLLAIFILWIFLRNIPLISIVALAIPVSVYSAFNFFYAYDISLNSLTLIGIALAVGMLIDNSVVVLENVYRLRSDGYSAADAVMKGTKEVWRSIVASTLTTITIFIPFMFSSNYLIQMFGSNIGVSIVSTLIISLLMAMIFIPMAIHLIIDRKGNHSIANLQKLSLDNRLVRVYLLLLKTALRKPAATIIFAIILFFVSIFAALSVSVTSYKQVESNQVVVYVSMPAGSTLDKSDEVVQEIEKRATGIAEVKDIICKVEEDKATVTFKLFEDYKDKSKRSFAEIKEQITKNIGDLSPAETSFTASLSSQGSGGGTRQSGGGSFQKLMGIGEAEEYLVVRGQDFELMALVASDIQYYLSELENMNRVRLTVRENQPEMQLNFDTRLMTDMGITYNQVASELGTFQKEVSTGVNFKQGTNQYEMVIKYSDDTTSVKTAAAKNKSLGELKRLGISNNQNSAVYELQSFSSFIIDKGLGRIDRVNQSKQIEVQYQFNSEIYESNTLKEVAKQEVEEVLAQYNMPAGVAVEFVEAESELDEFYSLIGIAILLIYIILASVFESFITPFVLLLSIPLAAIGSFLALVFSGNSLFNANTLTGFLILIGIVVNNSIILIDFTSILRDQGYRRSRALIVAGLSRLRPILITAITTIVGMVPLALGTSEYVSMIGAPFAITVIGGLSVSTLLTLVFVPSLYNGVENSLGWIKSLKVSTQIIIWVLVALLIGLVYFKVETLMWQILDYLLVITGVPTIFYFVISSLRRAETKLIGPDEPIVISIQNLVKEYGRSKQFGREWRAGIKRSIDLQNRLGIKGKPEEMIWSLPLVGFMYWFTWSYLTAGFWILLFSIINWVVLRGFISSYQKNAPKLVGIIQKCVTYGIPALSVAIFYLKNPNIGLSIVLFLVWYLLIILNAVADMAILDSKNPRLQKKIFKMLMAIVNVTPGIKPAEKSFKALKGVSLEIETGMFGLLGPNGAGKSTMMRIICGIYEQSYGKVWINGIDTSEKREELQGLIGFLPQEFGMYENLSAWDYLDYQAILKGLKDAETRYQRITYVLTAVHMIDQKDKLIGSFSGGMKQRVGIAQILLSLPRILVVDEPTAGLDPRERIRFRNLLVELSRNRVVIFSTHIIEDISSSCNRMAVINKGNVVYTGSPSKMTELAEGHIWKFTIKDTQYEAVTKSLTVIHHIRDGENIRVRVLSKEIPIEGAEPDKPMLEDAYLWLLKQN